MSCYLQKGKPFIYDPSNATRISRYFQLNNNLTSKDYANQIRMKIEDTKTWNDPGHYGASFDSGAEDHGTAHLSVLAPNGDAVSVTSTINY